MAMLQKQIVLLLGLVSAGFSGNVFCNPPQGSPVTPLSPLTICKALDTASKLLGTPPADFKPTNDQQCAFLSNYFALYQKQVTDSTFQPNELQSFVSRDAAELNNILRAHGFSIQLRPFRNESSVGIVAMQDILVKWRAKARCKTMQSEEKEYPSFFLPDETNGITFFKTENDAQGQETVIARIKTQTDDVVYCAVRVQDVDGKKKLVPFFDGNEEAVPTDAAVTQAISSLQSMRGKLQWSSRYNGVELPMIQYQDRPSLEWLKQLQVGPEYVVEQALQEVTFKMNEDGARAKAAVAIELSKCAMPESPAPRQEPLVVNQPFLLWIERPGVPAELPLFAAYLRRTYWKNPSNLS